MISHRKAPSHNELKRQRDDYLLILCNQMYADKICVNVLYFPRIEKYS